MLEIHARLSLAPYSCQVKIMAAATKAEGFNCSLCRNPSLMRATVSEFSFDVEFPSERDLVMSKGLPKRGYFHNSFRILTSKPDIIGDHFKFCCAFAIFYSDSQLPTQVFSKANGKI